jgi:hypothetical protein
LRGGWLEAVKGKNKRLERIVWRDFDIIQGIYLKQMQDKCNLGIFFGNFRKGMGGKMGGFCRR